MMLAGDVGATKTNLAIFTLAGGSLEILVEERFLNHEHTTLEQMVGEFTARHGRKPAAACFGVAGPVADGRTHMPNTGWEFDARELGRALGVDRVVLLNDLEATGYRGSTLTDKDFAVLNEGTPRTGANAAIIAAGTRLGEAILFWDGIRYRVSASEGGHADFGTRGEEQKRILAWLAERVDHVSYQRMLSGPGLHNVYEALDASESPALAERVALKIVHKLGDGTFMRAFCDKDRFADLLRGIPLEVIMDPTAALCGAAAYLAGAQLGRSRVASTARPQGKQRS